MKLAVFLGLACSLSLFGEDITPRVGLIEIYGTHRISQHRILDAIEVKPGDPMPSRGELEDRIGKVSGVLASRVEGICCLNGQPILYVGIEERGAPHIEYYPEPAGTVALPQTIQEKYNALLEATAASLRGKNADEDLTNGYSLMADPEGRQLQQGLVPLVAANLKQVDQVLRQSADPEQRAAAAYVLQYGPRGERDVKLITDDLQYALRDPDDNVRRNAVLAIKAVLVGATLHPEQGIHIEPTWFVELMNSAVWSERHNAALALLTLTDKKSPETLELIRERALSSVVEMARWHDLEHALPGFLLAGRLAGLTDQEIREAWSSGDR